MWSRGRLLFPTLLNIDPDTAGLIPADEQSGLVDSWEIEGNTVTYHLRDDKFWSDGRAITAYDVFFSYQVGQLENLYRVLLNQHIEAGAPLDEHTIRFIFSDLDCDDLTQSNFPIIPAHVYDPDFASRVDYAEGDDLVAWFDDFPKLNKELIINHPDYSNPSVTGGIYRLAERRFDESIHLIASDNSVAFSYVNVSSSNAAVDRYLRGDLNLVVEAPYNRRADLRADETTAIHSFIGDTSYFIALNLAAPDDPQATFDEGSNPIEQKIHPILGDGAVRQAMQMALDVPAMIEALLDGDGTQIASSLPPSGFGFNPDLEPINYDTMTARQILFDAGWRDMDGDGWRECLNCKLAERGQQLSISFKYYPESIAIPPVDNRALATMIQQQLGDIGIEIILVDQSSVEYDQNFDAILVDDVSPNLLIATMWDLFRPSQVTGEGLNFTSYANEEVSRLLTEADHTPDCDADTRRALYQEVEAILQADQPYLWLFSPNRMIATRQMLDLSVNSWEELLP